MFSIQKAAAIYGVQLNAYNTSLSGLAQAATGNGGAVVAHLNLGGGMGHFVVVTAVQNGSVTYVDSDGSKKTVSSQIFQQGMGRFYTFREDCKRPGHQFSFSKRFTGKNRRRGHGNSNFAGRRKSVLLLNNSVNSRALCQVLIYHRLLL